MQGVNIYQSAVCYVSMDLSQQTLEINGKLFSNFEIIFELITKNKNIQKDTETSIWIEILGVLLWNSDSYLIFMHGCRADICADKHVL